MVAQVALLPRLEFEHVWAAAAAAAGGGRKCRTEAFDCFAPAKAGAGRANSHTNRSVAGARAMVRCVTESATEEAELQSSHAIGGGGGAPRSASPSPPLRPSPHCCSCARPTASPFSAKRLCALNGPSFGRRTSKGCICRAQEGDARTVDPHGGHSKASRPRRHAGVGMGGLTGCRRSPPSRCWTSSSCPSSQPSPADPSSWAPGA